ncbi:MAG: helix-turn-helix transcriptional regulator [Isosphaeraceae bacterium]
MSLAQRVRDFRYSKGWGPDELATRAAISRTALYQIESGKTELPRAGTLRRIAMALDVSRETLLGHAEPTPGRPARATAAVSPASAPSSNAWTRGSSEWYPAEGAAMSTPAPRLMPRYDVSEAPRYASEFGGSAPSPYDPTPLSRERELTGKFHEILGSPFGEAVARIVDETYRLLPAPVATAVTSTTVRSL